MYAHVHTYMYACIFMYICIYTCMYKSVCEYNKSQMLYYVKGIMLHNVITEASYNAIALTYCNIITLE